MLQNTAYHMQATVVLSNGIKTADHDRTFTTGEAALEFRLLNDGLAASSARQYVLPRIPHSKPVSGSAVVRVLDKVRHEECVAGNSLLRPRLFGKRKRDVASANRAFRIAAPAGCDDDILAAIDHVGARRGHPGEGKLSLPEELPGAHIECAELAVGHG